MDHKRPYAYSKDPGCVKLTHLLDQLVSSRAALSLRLISRSINRELETSRNKWVLS